MSEDDDKSQTQKIRARMKKAQVATMNQFELAKLGLSRMTSKGNLYEPTTKGTVTHEGFLLKKSPGGVPLMRHWRKRWFVLESPGKLLYFADQQKTDLKGIIPLDMIEKMLFRATRMTLLMEGTSEHEPPRKFCLKGDSDSAVERWGAAINKAFEELDRLEQEEDEDEKLDGIDEKDAKYWKVDTRKKLNLSVALEDKPKKKKGPVLKIDPRAKDIEAQLAERDAAELKQQSVAANFSPGSSQNAEAGYMSLNDDHVSASSASPSSPSPDRQQEQHAASEQAERERAERQRAREMQEEADLLAAVAASQMDSSPPMEIAG